MKLLFRNPAYRILTLSRFFNAFGASIFNLVFIVYASTLPQASFAVAMANIVMILPTLFTVFVGIRADYTRDKVKWMTYSGLFQALLFFLAALVLGQASLFAFSSLKQTTIDHPFDLGPRIICPNPYKNCKESRKNHDNIRHSNSKGGLWQGRCIDDKYQIEN